MVYVHKPDGEWRVRLLVSSKNCPMLYYPNSIHGCEILSKRFGDSIECSEVNCPLKTSYQPPDKSKWNLTGGYE